MRRSETVAIRRGAGGGTVLRQAVVATRPAERAWGLLGRVAMGPEEAMIFPGCASIHTWFMRMSIDVIFLRRGEVVKVARAVPPFRMAWAAGADTVVEMGAGQAAACRITPGVTLQWD